MIIKKCENCGYIQSTRANKPRCSRCGSVDMSEVNQEHKSHTHLTDDKNLFPNNNPKKSGFDAELNNTLEQIKKASLIQILRQNPEKLLMSNTDNNSTEMLKMLMQQNEHLLSTITDLQTPEEPDISEILANLKSGDINKEQIADFVSKNPDIVKKILG